MTNLATKIQQAYRELPLRTRAVGAARIGITMAGYEQKIAAGQKWCWKCAAWHPASEFHADRSRWDGLKAVCYRASVGSKTTPGQRKRRQHAALGERWCHGCRKWLAASSITSQGACRPCINSEDRARYALVPRDATRARRQARELGLDPIPGWWRVEAFQAFNGLCAYGCGRAATTIDHIWPISRNGISDPGNLVPACRSCNSGKRAKNPGPWVEQGHAAFPNQWADIVALSIEHNCDLWTVQT